MSTLEQIWDNLLSRDKEKVLTTYNRLSEEEQTAVQAHLKRMTEEDGWHPEQQISASYALKALKGPK